MKGLVKNLIIWVIALLIAVPVFSQSESIVNVRFSVPEIAVVDIEPELNNIAFSVDASSDPGGKPVVQQVSGEPIWINYSSAIRKNGNKRSITAQISDSDVPDGISFYIDASPATAFGSTNQGISAGKVLISTMPKPIITGIGSCYTGDGVNMGHEIKYSIDISDFTKIETVGDQVFTVLYTITDN